MAIINYSGSQDITGCTITTWTDSTYYSFKLTQDCKISISGTPAINAKSGQEFVIQVNEAYIFDRDTKVMLAYPEADAAVGATIYESVTTSDYTFYSASGSSTVAAIQTAEVAYTSYTIVVNLIYWSLNTENITVNVLLNTSTVLATLTLSAPSSAGTYFSINEALTTTIPANSTIELDVENGNVNNAVVGSRMPTLLRLTETL